VLFIMTMIILLSASSVKALNVQYVLATGEVTNVTANAVPEVTGYGVLVDPVLPSIAGCSGVPPARMLVIITGVVTMRTEAGCFTGVWNPTGDYVINRTELKELILRYMGQALDLFDSAAPFKSMQAEITSICPVTDLSASCTTLRNRASVLKSTAETLITSEGY
jgi:hypothetical protein